MGAGFMSWQTTRGEISVRAADPKPVRVCADLAASDTDLRGEFEPQRRNRRQKIDGEPRAWSLGGMRAPSDWHDAARGRC